MAISLKKLDQRTNIFTLTYAGETMEVEYRPAAISKPEYFKKLEKLKVLEESLVFQLQTAIVRWDLLDEQGSPLPINLETIQSVERTFWMALITGINEDMERRYKEKKA